jgi:hypothetical protein
MFYSYTGSEHQKNMSHRISLFATQVPKIMLQAIVIYSLKVFIRDWAILLV